VSLHTPATDLRKGFDALSGLVTAAFAQNPTSGHLFLFVNRRRDRIKIFEAAKLHDPTIRERDQLVEELRRQIELYRRYVFGPRRERIADAPGQGRLFDSDAIDGVALRSSATTAAGSGTPNSDSATFRPASKRWPASITRSTIFPLRLCRLL
jgi:IS66 Orf2 like protein